MKKEKGHKCFPSAVEMFLVRMKGKIKRGEYDEFIENVPFASKGMLYGAITAKVSERLEKGETPILNKADISECIKETISNSLEIFKLFIGSEVLEDSEEGFMLNPIVREILNEKENDK